MKFSVITVSLNSEETIERTIKSVLNQQGVELEYIVIDGGSTDSTVKIIKKYENQIAYWCSEPDGGIYEAMNKGITFATGDVISFINSNDWYADSALYCVQQKMLEDNFDLVCGKVARVKNGMIVRTSIRPEEETDLYYRMFYPHPGIFTRRTVFSEFGGFDLQYRICADYDWLLRVYNQGVRIAYIDTLVSFFSEGGISSGYSALAEKKAVCLKNLPPAWDEKYRHKIEREYDNVMFAGKYRFALDCLRKDHHLARKIKETLQIDNECSLFGAGIKAGECRELFQCLNIKIEHIYDNDKNKQGKELWGIVVEPPDYICLDETIVIGTKLYADEIKNQLAAHQITRNIVYSDIQKIVVSCVEKFKGKPIDLEDIENV